MAPNNISFPIRTSTGKAAKWAPRAVRSSALSKAPTSCNLTKAEFMLSSEGGSNVSPEIEFYLV